MQYEQPWSNKMAQEIESYYEDFLSSKLTDEEELDWEEPMPEEEQVLTNSHFLHARTKAFTAPIIQAIHSENEFKLRAYIDLLLAGEPSENAWLWKDSSGCEHYLLAMSSSEIKDYFFGEYDIHSKVDSYFEEIMISPRAQSLFIEWHPSMSVVDYISANIGIALRYH